MPLNFARALHRPRPFLKSRAALFGLALGLGCLSRCASPRPPEKSLVGLSAALGRASGGVVDEQDLAWEESPGFWTETFLGRHLLFLSRNANGAPRDLYRARVRVTRGGQIIEVRDVRNLTDTPQGDDVGLEARGQRASFATLAYGKIQGIAVLELAGIRSSDRPESWLDRAMLALTSFQQTGSLHGIGRTDIVLDVPADHAKLSLESEQLNVDFGKGSGFGYDVTSRKLSAQGGGPLPPARAIPQVYGSKQLVHWAVDTVRAEVGPAPIAWLENKVFGAEDGLKRAAYKLFSSKASTELKAGAETAAVARVLDAAAFDGAVDSWPPPNVPSIWKDAKPTEGAWKAVSYPFLKPMLGLKEGAEKPPAYFYRTTIRPDPKRPYSQVLLIALDMRQLELGMQAGFEDPKPTIGPPGDGRLPDDPKKYRRIVATFNGAFKTTHGAYGMMVNHRVLLPPVKGGASVVVTDTGEVGLGSWPSTFEIPKNVVSFRQNLDPLVEDGVANPTGRNLWGWQLEGESVMTHRSALCVTSAGHLYYAWGDEIDGATLGKALRQAGCSYGIHLDMNPAHTGFIFMDVLNPSKKKAELRIADPGMKMSVDKYVRGAPKDFFYVMVRDATPPAQEGLTWTPDGGAQPPPGWMTGIFSAKLAIGSVEVALTRFEKGHVSLRARAGSKEPGAWGKPGVKLSLDDKEAHEVLAAIGLGHTTDSTRYGLSFAGAQAISHRSAYASLVVSSRGELRLVPSGALELAVDDDAVQLPLLVRDGNVEPRARERGDLRQRGALCVAPDGALVVALARHDSSDAVATSLTRAGCRDAVELDRGSHHPAFVHRAGGAAPPLASYETSVLYALGRPMLPRAFRWKPEGSAPSTKVTSYDVGRPLPDDPESRKKRKKEREQREREKAGEATASGETTDPKRP
ncbi:MAG: hypothetical protein EOO73_33910 [Myxococcales bacterium]|nr:MAG: hypothetical protein EOO73_33910 [Myxococcales bacterium]